MRAATVSYRGCLEQTLHYINPDRKGKKKIREEAALEVGCDYDYRWNKTLSFLHLKSSKESRILREVERYGV